MKPTCVCDLCELGIRTQGLCYAGGIKQCHKNGTYTLFEPRLPEGERADAGQAREELRRIRGLLEIVVQEVAKESYTHF